MFSNLCASVLAGRGGFDRFGGYGGMMGSGFGWIGLIIHGLFSLAALVLFIILIVWLVRAVKRNRTMPNFHGFTPHNEAASALKLLNERYARGEISEEEYLKVKKNLTE